jgi:hypothetical protein
MIKYVAAALLLSFCVSCSRDIHPIKTRTLSQKNPTSYVFPGSVPEAKGKMLTAFKDFQIMKEFLSTFSPNNPSMSYNVEDKEHAVFSEHIFANRENQDDLYFHFYGDVIDPSPVYFGGGKPLGYRAKFQLHLTPVDDNRTQVAVITHDPTVINGSKCCGPHGYVANDVAVEPTTIEEYKILMFIGRVLGERDMPPLRLPEIDK